MKQKLLNSGWPVLLAATAIILFAIVGTLLAQQKTVNASADTLDQAKTLLAQGNAQAAKALLESIDKGDADYGTAMSYDALCLYVLKDRRAFVNLVDSPAVQSAKIPDDFREDLEFKQIDALLNFKPADPQFVSPVLYKLE